MSKIQIGNTEISAVYISDSSRVLKEIANIQFGSTTVFSSTNNITVTKNTGISKIYYKINGASEWEEWSSGALSAYNGTIVYWYATTEDGYTGSGLGTPGSPNSFAAGTSSTIAPAAALNTYTITYKYYSAYGTWATTDVVYHYNDSPEDAPPVSGTVPTPATVASGNKRSVPSNWDSLVNVTGARTITMCYTEQRNVTSISGTNCSAYTDINYTTVFSTGWKDVGTVIYWKANDNYGFNSNGKTDDTTTIQSSDIGGAYNKATTYVNVTDLRAENCTAYTSTSYDAKFTTGWKANNTTIYWKAAPGYHFGLNRDEIAITSTVVPGSNIASAEINEYEITFIKKSQPATGAQSLGTVSTDNSVAGDTSVKVNYGGSYNKTFSKTGYDPVTVSGSNIMADDDAIEVILKPIQYTISQTNISSATASVDYNWVYYGYNATQTVTPNIGYDYTVGSTRYHHNNAYTRLSGSVTSNYTFNSLTMNKFGYTVSGGSSSNGSITWTGGTKIGEAATWTIIANTGYVRPTPYTGTAIISSDHFTLNEANKTAVYDTSMGACTRISGTISQGTLPTGVASITCYRKAWNASSFTAYSGSIIYYGDKFYWTATAANGYDTPTITYGTSSNFYTWSGNQGGSITSVNVSGLQAGQATDGTWYTLWTGQQALSDPLGMPGDSATTTTQITGSSIHNLVDLPSDYIFRAKCIMSSDGTTNSNSTRWVYSNGDSISFTASSGSKYKDVRVSPPTRIDSSTIGITTQIYGSSSQVYPCAVEVLQIDCNYEPKFNVIFDASATGVYRVHYKIGDASWTYTQGTTTKQVADGTTVRVWAEANGTYTITGTYSSYTSQSHCKILTISSDTTVKPTAAESSCVAWDSHINTDLAGNYKLAKDVAVGDMIATMDSTGAKSLSRVETVFVQPNPGVYYTIVTPSASLQISGHHPILTENGYKTIQLSDGLETITCDDKLATANGSYERIISITPELISTPAYNFLTEADNYIVNNYIVACEDEEILACCSTVADGVAVKPGECVAGETKIKAKNSAGFILAKDIAIGDIIYGVGDDNTYAVKNILISKKHPAMYNITIGSTNLMLTGMHPILTTTGYKIINTDEPAFKLAIGDSICLYDNKIETITDISKVAYEEPVYNFITEADNYVANEIIVACENTMANDFYGTYQVADAGGNTNLKN